MTTGGRTVYYTATSLDGFIADEEHSLEWLFTVAGAEPAAAAFATFFDGVGAMAMGATTYLWVVEHEKLLEAPEKWTSSYGDTPCWVFSHRDLPSIRGANLRFVEGSVAPLHAEMKDAAGPKNVWLVGGGDLVGQFADHGLLDEMEIAVAPVTLGQGAPLLPRRLTGERLELVEAVRDGQFAKLRYHVHG